MEIIQKYKKMSVVVKASMWFMVCSIMQKAVALLTTPIFTRLLTTEQYGQYSLYNSWLSIFTIFCTFRLEKAVFNKGMSKFPEERNQYSASMQSATSLLTFFVFLLYLVFRKQINGITELSTLVMCVMFVELFFHPAMVFYTNAKRYEYKYISVIVVTLLYTVFNTVLGIFAVLVVESSHRGTARIFSCATATAIFGVFLYFYNWRHANYRIQWKHIKFAVCFNAPLIPHYFSSFLLEQSDRLMISKICGVDKLGIYGVAYNVGLLLKFVTDSIHSAVTPWQYEKMRKGEFKPINAMLAAYMLMVTLLLSVFMAFAPEALWILADRSYYEAVYVIPPVTASIFFICVYGIYSNAEFYFGANKFSSILTMVGAILNVVLNFVFIPIFGFVAAGYTTLVCYTVFAYAHFIYANKLAKQQNGKSAFEIKGFICFTVIIYVATVGISFLYENMLLRYAVILLLGAILLIKRQKLFSVLKLVKGKGDL